MGAPNYPTLIDTIYAKTKEILKKSLKITKSLYHKSTEYVKPNDKLMFNNIWITRFDYVFTEDEIAQIVESLPLDINGHISELAMELSSSVWCEANDNYTTCNRCPNEEGYVCFRKV